MTTLSPFRIGGVKPIPGTTEVDSPVIKFGNQVVVQGTSLKGAIRHEVETFLIDTYFDKQTKSWKEDGLKPCIPADARTVTRDEQSLIQRGFYKLSCSYPNPDDYICPACYLLGARGLVGFVSVPFLKMTKGTVEPLQFIRADRVVGTSARGEFGAIGKFEGIPEGSEFEGNMTILDEDDVLGWSFGNRRELTESRGDKWLESSEWNKDLILKSLVVQRLQNIKHMGGFRSKGFGEVSIKVTPA